MQTHTCEKKWAIDHTHTLIFKTHIFFQVCKGSTTQYHVLEKPKEVGQASLDWNTHSSPCSLNNLKQVARHIWVSRKIRVIVKLDTDYNWVRIFFLQSRHLLDQKLSHPPVWAVCFLCLWFSLSLLYLWFLSIALSANTGAQHLDIFSFHTVLLGLKFAL